MAKWTDVKPLNTSKIIKTLLSQKPITLAVSWS